jgi:hypothetical protein
MFGTIQAKNEVTVLYLLPFHLNEDADYLSIKSNTEINQVKQFEMIGFWLGAKMALQTYENSDKVVNVIVRDAVTDISALKTILDDTTLMSRVHIIIGPFYGSIFPVASDFAKSHNIIIINPFSTRHDFVVTNPYVYKLVPPFSSRPKMITELFLEDSMLYNIILWGDSVRNPELQAYKKYFSTHQIPYQETHTVSLPEHSNQSNLIIALFEQPTRVIHGVHSLINRTVEKDIVVVPEQWLSISELTEDFFNLPHLYYFTNYFVDENSAEIKQFKADHILFYEAPAELVTYSYQGYDITRYFIDLFFADYDFNEVKFTPFSYQFQWKEIPDGGFENNKVRFIRIKDLELKEVR